MRLSRRSTVVGLAACAAVAIALSVLSVPLPGRAEGAATQATPTAPIAPAVGGGFTGALPSGGGIALLVTSEDSDPPSLAEQLTAAGCEATSLFLLQAGSWSGFIVGAPAVVNAGFPGLLLAGTPFFVRCSEAAPTATVPPTPASSGTALADSRIPVMDIVDRPPPSASLITVGTPAADGTTTVSGAPGAVPPRAVVLVASVAYSDPDFVQADQDGSFDAAIPAAPGDTVQIRYLDLVFNPDFVLDPSASPGLLNKTHWPGTLVRAPQSEPAIGFAGAYYLIVESGILRGFASGTVSETSLAVGGSSSVAGTVAFRIPAGALAPSAGSYGASLWLSPLFDAAGNQVGTGTDFISHLLTPTGLPIERSSLSGQEMGPLQVTPLERVGDLLTGSFSSDGSAAIPGVVPDGIYRLAVRFRPNPELRALGVHTKDPAIGFTQPTDGFVSAAIVAVGDPAPPRLAPMLLTNSASQGQRGTVARGDAGRIAFANRIATAGRRLVIPPLELGSDDLIEYRLEPFLPFVSLADRRITQEPAIPFDLPGGSLAVTVIAPSGRSEALGTHTTQQARTGDGSSSRGHELVRGGGNPGSVYQFTTLSDDFAYQFREYGRYEIRLSGSVTDIWGTSYSLDSIFDVWVAETLDLEASSLPSTPFEVGDSLPASLTLFPGVPAAIEWEVTVHPIDGSDPVTRTITGTANRFGYFGVADAFPFDVAEYVSTIHASYTDSEGRLWMADPHLGQRHRHAGRGPHRPWPSRDRSAAGRSTRGLVHPLVHRDSRGLQPHLLPLPLGGHPLVDGRRRDAAPHLRPGHRWCDRGTHSRPLRPDQFRGRPRAARRPRRASARNQHLDGCGPHHRSRPHRSTGVRLPSRRASGDSGPRDHRARSH